MSRRGGIFLIVVAVVGSGQFTNDLSARAVRPPMTSSVFTAGPTIPGSTCPVFPANNVWNTPITDLPVNSHSSTWLASMSASTSFLHPDYGPSGDVKHPYGIPWNIVPAQTAFTHVSFQYSSESDHVLYPLTAHTPIEGGSDRHALMVEPLKGASSAACTLYETFATHYRSGGHSTAGSGAVWNLQSNALRTAGFTSADAAGLPILPGLVKYNEVVAGTLHHAIRFTVNCTHDSYVWPARHHAGVADPTCPPMGARFRLDALFTLPSSQCGPHCQSILTTMKTYGLIVADNGSNWFFQGTADSRWTNGDVDQLKQIPANAFVAVDESCLMQSTNSGAAWQAGSVQYQNRCG